MTEQRRSLMTRPVPARRQTLAKQAEEIKAHYNATREERISRQGGRIYQYDLQGAPSEDRWQTRKEE